VRKKLGCSRTSLGSLSEAARVFDAGALQAIVGELAQQALPLHKGKDADILRGLTAVDGTLLPALPKMAWALWVDEEHRAAKLHLHFDVFKGIPCHASITDGNGNEKKELRAALQSKRLYVIDRGYAEYQLFQDIIDARSSFIGRIRDNAVYEVVEERSLSDDARKAGVLRDCVVWLGCEQSGAVLKQSCVWLPSPPTERTARASRRFFSWPAIAWISTLRGSRWAIGIAGRSSFSSAGSSASWAANICCPPAQMAWRSRSTWP
jgi:Transposase DDE domain